MAAATLRPSMVNVPFEIAERSKNLIMRVFGAYAWYSSAEIELEKELRKCIREANDLVAITKKYVPKLTYKKAKQDYEEFMKMYERVRSLDVHNKAVNDKIKATYGKVLHILASVVDIFEEELTNKLYGKDFVKKIKRAEKARKEGRYEVLSEQQIKDLCGL